MVQPQSSGLARRRRRLSDEETQERMLHAAVEMVNQSGLTVSLDHISFEDVIRAADVSRTAVYRKWPYKDLFFSDLLRELAGGTSPAIAEGNPDAIKTINTILLDHLDWLDTAPQRRALVAEALRQGALNEFETFRDSPVWRTYYALQATFLSLPDGELRYQVRSAMTESEENLMTRIAGAYEHAVTLLGMRLRPETGATFHTLARLVSATIRGMVLMAPTNPEIAEERVTANPFGAPEPAPWSQPALGIASTVLSFVETNPAVKWTGKTTEEVRKVLTSGRWASY